MNVRHAPRPNRGKPKALFAAALARWLRTPIALPSGMVVLRHGVLSQVMHTAEAVAPDYPGETLAISTLRRAKLHDGEPDRIYAEAERIAPGIYDGFPNQLSANAIARIAVILARLTDDAQFGKPGLRGARSNGHNQAILPTF